LHQPVGCAHTDVDEPPRGWDTAPACVPRHDVGRGAGTNLQVRIGAAPIFRTAVSASSSDLGVAAPCSGTLVSWLSRLEPRMKIITALQMESDQLWRLEHRKTPHAWVEKRRRSDRPDDKRAATVGCLRSGYALPPAAHCLILIVADDLPSERLGRQLRYGSSEPSTPQWRSDRDS
jgi:hypothetical protein